MGDDLVLDVDHLIKPATVESMQVAEEPGSSGESSCVHDEAPTSSSSSAPPMHSGDDKKMSYTPGYTAPPPRVPSDDTAIDISGGWTISGTPLDLHDPRLLAMAAAERHFLEAEYDDYAATNASGAAFCRSAALILMALLLLRHALAITNGEGKDDASAFFSLFLLRAAGFLLPCYIMAWAISILQRRRQRQEAAALAAAEVAFVLQSGQRRGLQFTIAPGPTATPHQEPLQ
ncbi:hypothetical protein MRB53_021896 [Persea americana]|uniref:Uncharacterized protein n=1 Tax=Persea americana TaxID=3435 RepID=A0ACC2L6A4_PERAE|nr:hypothetical protein MRB53_021896 [Persea americana]